MIIELQTKDQHSNLLRALKTSIISSIYIVKLLQDKVQYWYVLESATNNIEEANLW